MRFLCQGCRTKYQVADEKVRGKILTIRCRSCGAMMHVRESLARDGSISVAELVSQGAQPRQVVAAQRFAASATIDLAVGDDQPTSVGQPRAGASSAPVEWFVALDGAQHGPFSEAELTQRIKANDVGPRHYVWREDYSGWKRLRDVPELAWALAAQRSAPPQAEPAPGRVVDLAERRAEREAESLSPERFEPTPRAALKPEDVFQSVPRAHAAVAKENTRFFVEAAGVGLQKSKNKAGLVVGLVGLSLTTLFVAAWAAGYVRVSVPWIMSAPEPSRAQERSEETTADLSERERRVLKGLSGEDPKRRPRRVQDPRAVTAGLPLEPEHTLGSRGLDDNGRLPIDLRPGAVPERAEPIGEREPSSQLAPIPPVDGTLDAASLRKVVRENKVAVEGCFRRERRPITEQVRIEFLVTVQPSGAVSQVLLKTPELKQSSFAGCIAERIQDWKFPAFPGGPVQVLVPFVRMPAS